MIKTIPPILILFSVGLFCQGQEEGELIFSLDHKPTPECHASSIVETGSGLVAAWFGGKHERHPDVGIWISRKEKGHWSPPVEVVNGIQNESLRFPCWNPVLFQPEGGPLMLFYKVGPNPREWWGELMVSADQGRTWSESRRLGEGRLGPLVGPVKNKPIQLKDGSILCPSSMEFEVEGETFWKCHFELTRDLGASWEIIGPVNEGITFDAIQPSILSYENNRMQILCRSRQDVVVQCWSADGGQSWGEMTVTSLPNPNSGTDAVTLMDGRIHITYTYRRESIKHVVFDPQAL